MGKRRIIFRADGNAKIGMGHFIRSLALAEMLKDNFVCIYATQVPTEYQINEIEAVCNERIDLPDDETHFKLFLDLLKGNEIVVLDNYYFSTEYQLAIKSIGCKLVCIDDIHDKHFVADLIINHAEGINEGQYSTEKYTAFCLGYKFALLRHDYLSNVSVEIAKQYSCMVMIGGADPFHLTEKIIEMIQPVQFSLPIAVVLGAGYNNEHSFIFNNNLELFKGIGSSKVFQLMQVAKIGIFPASTVAIEACAARLPFICGYFVDNQKEIYNGIQNNNLAICIGNYSNVVKKDFGTAFKQISQREISERIIQNQIALLDKKSKERYIKIFNQLWKSASETL